MVCSIVFTYQDYIRKRFLLDPILGVICAFYSLIEAFTQKVGFSYNCLALIILRALELGYLP